LQFIVLIPVAPVIRLIPVSLIILDVEVALLFDTPNETPKFEEMNIFPPVELRYMYLPFKDMLHTVKTEVAVLNDGVMDVNVHEEP
jgi:hypothetical protein